MTDKNRSQWDLGRFIETLTYFEVIPFLNWVQQLIQGRPKDIQNIPNGGRNMGVILVAGATGGVGKRVYGDCNNRVIKCGRSCEISTGHGQLSVMMLT